jgi:hypothetical protein
VTPAKNRGSMPLGKIELPWRTQQPFTDVRIVSYKSSTAKINGIFSRHQELVVVTIVMVVVAIVMTVVTIVMAVVSK